MVHVSDAPALPPVWSAVIWWAEQLSRLKAALWSMITKHAHLMCFIQKTPPFSVHIVLLENNFQWLSNVHLFGLKWISTVGPLFVPCWDDLTDARSFNPDRLTYLWLIWFFKQVFNLTDLIKIDGLSCLRLLRIHWKGQILYCIWKHNQKCSNWQAARQ